MQFKVGDKVISKIKIGEFKDYIGIIKKTYTSSWSKEDYIEVENNFKDLRTFYAKDFVKLNLINHPNTNIFK